MGKLKIRSSRTHQRDGPRRRVLRLRTVVVLALVLVVSFFQLFRRTPAEPLLLSVSQEGGILSRWLRAEPRGICIVGNSQTQAQALRVFKHWDCQLPTVMFVWGDEQEAASDPYPGHLRFLTPEQGEPVPSFTEGIYLATRAAVQSHNCEYIFTHDDDLVFRLDPVVQLAGSSRQSEAAARVAELRRLLKRYKPAVAGFPWAVGDDRFSTMRELKRAYAGQEVQPLTGFDNGMVVYHRSVLDFFLPFAPSGEGGFVGKWTLGAHFLQMFSSLLFGEHAIRLNTLPYENTINLDNIVKPDVKPQRTIVVTEGLASVPQSRHPYEYPMNDAYISFLESGLLDPSQAWGRGLGEHSARKPAIFGGAHGWYEPQWILDRLAKFYDVQHDALMNNHLLNSIPRAEIVRQARLQVLPVRRAGLDTGVKSPSQHGLESVPVLPVRKGKLEAIAPPPREERPPMHVFTFKVIFFTRNRLESFKRCWTSFQRSHAVSSHINVDIHVDFDPDMSDADRLAYTQYLNWIQASNNPATTVTIFRPTTRQGLKHSILHSWDAPKVHEYAVFLEDDIEVSPYFLQYAEAMVNAYVYRDAADHRLSAISLYNPVYNEAIESFVSVSNGNKPFVYQMPQSWGAVIMPGPWSDFLAFESVFGKTDVDPLVPDSMTNRWPWEVSWKKYLLRFMVQEGSYVLYQNLPNNLSYSTNHVEVGTNVGMQTTKARALINRKFTVPLLRTLSDLPPGYAPSYPTLDTLQVYSLQHLQVPNLDSLPSGKEHVESFDKCTMILTVYNRVESLIDRLTYYDKFDQLGQILVIWNNLEKDPEQSVYSNFSIPIEVLAMRKNSMNNRFYPWPQIKYSCIVNMDDDWNMPFEHMAYAIRVWKGHFHSHLVGMSHQGRNHVDGQMNGLATTLYSPTFLGPDLIGTKDPFYSIVLPSGFVYHRKYLDMYSFDLPQAAREVVDEVQNCDDILFNYMIANATHSGPAVIHTWAKMITGLGNDGLWARASHMSSRTDCMTRFNTIFGYNPLRYTTSMFPIQHTLTVPGLHHHFHQKKIPRGYDLTCNTTMLQIDNVCSLTRRIPTQG